MGCTPGAAALSLLCGYVAAARRGITRLCHAVCAMCRGISTATVRTHKYTSIQIGICICIVNDIHLLAAGKRVPTRWLPITCTCVYFRL